MKQGQRNHQFDICRILFSMFVLLSHAPEITDGNRSRELIHRFTHSSMSFGEVGVYGFFLLSGYLIVQSWDRDPEFLNFLRKRLLRIVPGYTVAVGLSTLFVGWFAPGVPAFFHHLGSLYFVSVLLLSSPLGPPVFPGLPINLINGPLYTITYEFRCYLLVGLLGLCGAVRRRVAWGFFTLVLTVLSWGELAGHLQWTRHELPLGDPHLVFKLTEIFFLGGCFYLFRDVIPFRPAFARVAACALIAITFASPQYLELAFVFFGAYLLFYLGRLRLPILNFMSRIPDVSYGIYLYGWPVECFWIWTHHESPWATFLVCAVLCFGLGWLSWQFVERPMLKLKRHATSPLPPTGKPSFSTTGVFPPAA